jgi:hypothetical protein
MPTDKEVMDAIDREFGYRPDETREKWVVYQS